MSSIRRPSAAMRFPAPIETKPGAVPADHRLGLDDHQSLFPVRANGAQEDPQQPIWFAEPGFSGVPVQHHELVPQGQVLEQQLPVRSEDCTQTPKHGKNYAKHDPRSLAQLTDRSTNSIRDEVFATDSYQNGIRADRANQPFRDENETHIDL
jgi:hypothetical protein